LTDEATSALDATSRLLVLEAIKQWRRNKTTIIITHDLSQISHDDFVFVMKDGINIEAGYCGDLEQMQDGFYTQMIKSQGIVPLPERDLDQELAEKDHQVQAVLDAQTEDKPFTTENFMIGPSLRPVSLANWMFDVVSDLTGTASSHREAMASPPRTSRFISPDAFRSSSDPRRLTALYVPSSTPIIQRTCSLQLPPNSPISFTQQPPPAYEANQTNFDLNMIDVKNSATHTITERQERQRIRRHQAELKTVKIDEVVSSADPTPSLTIWQLMREIYPTVPHKFLTLIGLMVAVASGAITPIFSFILSHLQSEVYAGAKDVSRINSLGMIVLALAAIDGILLGLKFFILEKVAISWVTLLRNKCYNLVLLQDKKWFDRVDGENGPSRMVQVLIKDGDDARSLIATVLPQTIVVIAMFGTGMIWAMATGWQLTLIGIAIAPVFAITMVVQTKLVSKCELRNKRAREDVAKQYYEVCFVVHSFSSWTKYSFSFRPSQMFVLSAEWPLESSSNVRSRNQLKRPTLLLLKGLTSKGALTVSQAPSFTCQRPFYSTPEQSLLFGEPIRTSNWSKFST
jgi:ATP-binding cassette, subfamily B (MDR/TAP), member 1